jgi:hypothetical protein
MRRAFLAVIAGSTLLAGSACDSDAKNTEAAPPPAMAKASPAPLPDYSADTSQVCGKLDSLYTTEVRAFGSAMGKMVTYKEEKQTAEAEKAERAAAGQLQAAATKIRKETAEAEDPDLQAAGKVSAAKLETSAKDHKYIARIKTIAELDKTIQGQFAEWLAPVTGYCGGTTP